MRAAGAAPAIHLSCTHEINVVEIFLRRGYRFKSEAELKPKGTDEYDFVTNPLWAENGHTYPVHEVIKVNIEQVREIRSPAYTYGEGITEEVLKETLLKKYGVKSDEHTL